MAGRLAGKVVFITGAARGMGRSHAVQLAREGADVIGVDICGPVRNADAAPSTPEDLAETVAEVEALGRRMVGFTADVRDEDALAAGLAAGVAELGRLDVAVANAGILTASCPVADLDAQAFRDAVDINLTSVFLTAKVAIPHIRTHGEGGSILLISSALGLRGQANQAAYVASKHGVVGLMRTLAAELGPDNIRVNSIHPTNVATPLILNDATYRAFRPDLDEPGIDDVRAGFQGLNLLPVPWIEPADVSEAVLYLAADSGRFITGSTHCVDAGRIAM